MRLLTYDGVPEISGGTPLCFGGREKGVFAAYSALYASSDGQLHCAWETGPAFWDYRDIAYTAFTLHGLAALL